MPAPQALALEEPQITSAGKACAVGGGVIAAVCCGGGLAAVVATLLGAVGAVSFMRTWANMQGITLLSTLFAILLIVGLARWLTRGYRQELSPAQYRDVFRRTLFRLSAWALAGYMFYMVVVTTVLNLIGFEYPRLIGE
jgi:hypothetical protein